MPSLDGGVLNQCVHLSTFLLEVLEVLTGLGAGSKSDTSWEEEQQQYSHQDQTLTSEGLVVPPPLLAPPMLLILVWREMTTE